jgi:hypothetical protein
VVADPGDFANSQNLLDFADLVATRSSSLTLKNQFIIDYIKTDKSPPTATPSRWSSSSSRTRSRLSRSSPVFSSLSSGGSVRYSWAKQLQDFAAEPFSRRDISKSQITSNSVVLAGPQRPLFGDTRNLWSQSSMTDLYQLALFSVGELKHSDAFSTYFSARIEGASFKNTIPSAHERNARRGQQVAKGGKNYYMASVNPVYKLSPNVSLYVSALYGTALTPRKGATLARRPTSVKRV